jgi:DsbC/DsbD-like thiol-disulfide interchange protein
MKIARSAVYSLCLPFCLYISALGQRPSEVVQWTSTTTKSTATSAAVKLSAQIEDGWHVYALSQPPGGPTPLRISLPAGSGVELEKPVVETEVSRHLDPNFKMETLYYLKAANFNLAIKKTGPTTSETVPIDVRFQACNDRLCLPPYTAHLTVQLARR